MGNRMKEYRAVWVENEFVKEEKKVTRGED